jgi:hypothetical protein
MLDDALARNLAVVFCGTAAGHRSARERIGRTIFYVAPSTSAAANGAWDITIWEDLAGRVRRHRCRLTAAAPDGGRVAAKSIRKR